MKKNRYQKYKRKDGSFSFIVDTRNAEGRKIRRAFQRLADADEFYEKTKRDRKRHSAGLDPIIEDIKLKEFADSWMKQRLDEGKPLSSWTSDEQRMRFYIKPYFGHMMMSRIQTYHIEKFLGTLIPQYKISPATRNLIRALMQSLFRDAIKLRHAAKNPVKETTKLPLPEQTINVWTSSAEVEAYLDQAAKDVTPWFYPLVNLSIQTGARLGEVLALRWDDDVNLEEGWICIRRTYERESKSVVERTKSKKPRWAGINGSLAKILGDYRSTRPKMLAKRGALLMTWDDGVIVNPRYVRRVHDRVCKRSGVRRIRIHDLRHQFATMFVKSKGNLYELQKLLGHSTPDMSQRYSHLDPSYLKGLASVVELSARSVKNDATKSPQKLSNESINGGVKKWKSK